MKTGIGLLSLLVAAASADPDPGPVGPGDIHVDIGMPEARSRLGYGWDRDEFSTKNLTQAWINRREADVRVEVDDPADMDFWMHAAPCLRLDRHQNIALYVNNRFIRSWVCPLSYRMRFFHARIPAGVWKKGANRLTFRVGYTMTPAGETRKLGMLVDAILLRKVEPAGDRGP